MALTLAEAAKLSNDMLLVGVIETIVKESPILQVLPFIEIVGNGLTYNQEATAPTAAFYDVGDVWTESTPTFEQKTAQLKILGGDADIDNFLLATRSNVQDLEAAIVQLKAKAVRQLFEDTFINGDAATNAKAFDGIDKLCDPSQTISMGPNGGTLTMEKLDELIDLIKGGKPDMLLMSRRTRRTLNRLARQSGAFLETDRNEFGQMIHIDPPYGIKCSSDFQPRIDRRDMKDKDEDLTHEPEQIKAYRDTWKPGTPSYLTCLRDRLLLARELLTESGSIFVQISVRVRRVWRIALC